MNIFKKYNTLEFKWGIISNYTYGVNNKFIIYGLLTVFCLLKKRILYGNISFHNNDSGIALLFNKTNLQCRFRNCICRLVYYYRQCYFYLPNN